MANGFSVENNQRLLDFNRRVLNKKIIVFGYGRRGSIIGNYLPVKVAFFVDNDPAKWQDDPPDCRVYDPEVLRHEDRDSVCIIVVSFYYKAILWQLQEMGYLEHQHVVNGLDFFGDVLDRKVSQGKTLPYDPSKVWLRGDPRIEGGCVFNGNNVVLDGSRLINTTMGRYSFIGRNCTIRNTHIGQFCSIATDVMIGLERHPSRGFISTYPAFYMERATGSPSFVRKQLFQDELPVKIGNDVWIGARALLLGGISVGNGAIVGAGALVTKDVEPYSIVGGVPAGLIRMRYSSEKIRKLLDFAWWDQDMKWIRNNAHSFSNEEELFKIIDRDKKSNI